jgi:hypothetical protein
MTNQPVDARLATLYVVAISMPHGGTRHEDIRRVRLRYADAPGSFEASMPEVAGWIRQRRADVRLACGGRELRVDVPAGNPRHLRAISNGSWTDDLLDLPHS